MALPTKPRRRAPRDPVVHQLWEASTRDVRMQRKRAGSGRHSHARRRLSVSAISGYAGFMIVVFAAALGWLNRDLIDRQIGGKLDDETFAVASDAAQQRAAAQEAALAVDPYAYSEAAEPTMAGDTGATISFALCHSGGGTNCVVDGDTFWLNGEKIRIADIDTPETHPPRCAAEAALGARATQRLQQLLNSGPISLAAAPGGSGYDRYGRRLAIVEQGGASIGMVLVAEGLARPYGGGPRGGWC